MRANLKVPKGSLPRPLLLGGFYFRRGIHLVNDLAGGSNCMKIGKKLYLFSEINKVMCNSASEFS